MAVPKAWKDEPTKTTPIDAAALIDLEERVLAAAIAAGGGLTEGQVETLIKAYSVALTTLAASGMGVVYHGSTAATARPTGYKYVTWIGSVEPSNAVEHDIWIEK